MSQLLEKITAEIQTKGPVSFARFMELALYCPVYGFYEKEEDTPGREGHYFTSVSVGPVFGQMLAFDFAEWLEDCRSRLPGRAMRLEAGIHIVEAGAQDGQLASDILDWLRGHRPEVFRSIQYWILEPSSRRRAWQKRKLHQFSDRLNWADDVRELTKSWSRLHRAGHSHGVRGMIFSNELLDSFPVHRFGWDAEKRAWFEWGVGLDGKRLMWTRMVDGSGQPTAARAGSISMLAPEKVLRSGGFEFNQELLEVLPNGFILEVCPAASQWWKQAAEAVEWGKLLTLDYGFLTEELFRPENIEGTLRAFQRHRASLDLLAHPGEQDITAHVNFSALRTAGEMAGLKTESFLTQARFLTGIGERIWQNPTYSREWSASQTRQFQTLTHPEHLGRSFRVLLQSRGC